MRIGDIDGKGLAEGMGFEPTVGFNTYNDLANRRLQPLGHPSAGREKSHDVCMGVLGFRPAPVKCALARQVSATSNPLAVAGRAIIAAYQRPTC